MKYITTKDFARMMDIKVQTAARLARLGIVKSIKTYGIWLIETEDAKKVCLHANKITKSKTNPWRYRIPPAEIVKN